MKYNSLKNHQSVHSRQQSHIIKKEGRKPYQQDPRGNIQSKEEKVVQIAWVDKMISQLNTFKQIIHDKEPIQKGGKHVKNQHKIMSSQLSYNEVNKTIYHSQAPKQSKYYQSTKNNKTFCQQNQNRFSYIKKQTKNIKTIQNDGLRYKYPSTPKSKHQEKNGMNNMIKNVDENYHKNQNQYIKIIDDCKKDGGEGKGKLQGYFSKEAQHFILNGLWKKQISNDSNNKKLCSDNRDQNLNKKSVGKIVKNKQKVHLSANNIDQPSLPFYQNFQSTPQKLYKMPSKQEQKSIKLIKQKSKMNKLNIKLHTQKLQEYLIQKSNQKVDQNQQFPIKIQQYAKYGSSKRQLPANNAFLPQKQKYTSKDQLQWTAGVKRDIIYDLRDRNPLKQKVNNLNIQIQKIQLKSKMLSGVSQYKNKSNSKQDYIKTIKQSNDSSYANYKTNSLTSNNTVITKRKQQRKLNTSSKSKNIHTQQPQIKLQIKKQYIKPSQLISNTFYSSNISSNVRQFVRQMQNKEDQSKFQKNTCFSGIQLQLDNSKVKTSCKESQQKSIKRSRRFDYEKDIQKIVQQKKQSSFTLNKQISEELQRQQIPVESHNKKQQQKSKKQATIINSIVDSDEVKKYNKIQHKSPYFVQQERINMECQQQSVIKINKKESLQNFSEVEVNNDDENKKSYNDQLILLFNFMDQNHRGLLTDTNCNINFLTEELKMLFSSIIIQIKSKKKFYNLNKFVQDSNEVIQIKNQLYFSNTSRKNVAYDILKENIQILKKKYPLQFVKCVFTCSTYDQSNAGSKKNSISNAQSLVISQIKGDKSKKSQNQSPFMKKNKNSFIDQLLYSARRVESKQKYLTKSIMNEERLNSQQPEIYLQDKYDINRNETIIQQNYEGNIIKSKHQSKF